MQPRKSFSLWMFIISALILVIFSVQNANEVTFNFFVWKTHLSLSILLIVAFLVGLIVGAIFSFRGKSKSKPQKVTEPAREKAPTPTKPEDMELEDTQRPDKP